MGEGKQYVALEMLFADGEIDLIPHVFLIRAKVVEGPGTFFEMDHQVFVSIGFPSDASFVDEGTIVRGGETEGVSMSRQIELETIGEPGFPVKNRCLDPIYLEVFVLGGNIVQHFDGGEARGFPFVRR